MVVATEWRGFDYFIFVVIAVKIKKNSDNTKFKVRCSRFLYTLVIKDKEKADKLKQSLPPGKLSAENFRYCFRFFVTANKSTYRFSVNIFSLGFCSRFVYSAKDLPFMGLQSKIKQQFTVKVARDPL